ncbi:MAG: hypothetical protein ACOX61_10925 [Brooklawnia sp.]|jgi:hypothetical protein
MGTFRRITAGALALVGAFVMVGCGSEADPATTDANTPSTSSTSTGPVVEVDEGLFKVDVKIRRSLLDFDSDMTDQDIIDAAEAKGMKATVDEETVTYTMTRAQQRELLDEMRGTVRQSLDEMVGDPDNSFSGIEVNNDLTSFSAKVNASTYSPFEGLYVIAFYVQGALYQQFAGVDAADIDITVELVDDQSGEVLETGSYREWMERQEG